MFPLAEPSQSVPDAPVLEPAEIDLIHKSSPAQMNLERSGQWYLGYLARSKDWLREHDHHHRRITRMIRSQRLLLGELAADSAREQVLKLAKQGKATIGDAAYAHWQSA